MEKKLEYNDKIIKYKIIKKKIKNMYIRIKDGNIVVSAPKNMNYTTIEEFVNSKRIWIFNALKQYERNKNQNIENNDMIRLLGNDYTLKKKYEKVEALYNIYDEKNLVEIYLPLEYKNLSKDKQELIINKYKQYIYKEILLDVVEKSLEKYQDLTGLKVNKCTLKQMKSAWGRCSSNRNISINIELAKYNTITIESVVLHEICHIKYMNHSPKYWNYVKSFMPDYDEVKKELTKK